MDRLAKRQRRSRSKIIEALVESSLKSGEGISRFTHFVGAWKDDRRAKEIIEESTKIGSEAADLNACRCNVPIGHGYDCFHVEGRAFSCR